MANHLYVIQPLLKYDILGGGGCLCDNFLQEHEFIIDQGVLQYGHEEGEHALLAVV